MRRRDLLAALGGAAVWLPRARAQERRIPTVGILDTTDKVAE